MTTGITKEQLKQYISKIEKLELEKANFVEDIKEVFNDAKANGYDIKIMKQILKIKKADRNKLAEQEAILELYMQALDL